MGNTFNFDSTVSLTDCAVVHLARLTVIQALLKNADEIILTLKSRAESIRDPANNPPPPDAENTQMVELVYVISDKGRVDFVPSPAFAFSALIRVLLLHSNIPRLRALFLRAGIPYWNHGPVEGTFQTTSHHLPELNTLWKLKSADTMRGLRLIRLRA